MQIMTKTLSKSLPPLGACDMDKDPMVRAKFFYPDFSWSWYAIEYDGEDLCYGFVDGEFPELGYFSLAELQQNRGKLGLAIERDRHFHPCPLSQIRKQEMRYKLEF